MPEQNFVEEEGEHTTSEIRNVSDPDFKVVYSNNAAFGMTLFDISATFGELIDVDTSTGKPVAVVNQQVRVIMSPIQAKVFASVFASQIQRYERQFGPIHIPVGPISTKESGSTIPMEHKPAKEGG